MVYGERWGAVCPFEMLCVGVWVCVCVRCVHGCVRALGRGGVFWPMGLSMCDYLLYHKSNVPSRHGRDTPGLVRVRVESTPQPRYFVINSVSREAGIGPRDIM